jgi:hypothetical protein
MRHMVSLNEFRINRTRTRHHPFNIPIRKTGPDRPPGPALARCSGGVCRLRTDLDNSPPCFPQRGKKESK